MTTSTAMPTQSGKRKPRLVLIALILALVVLIVLGVFFHAKVQGIFGGAAVESTAEKQRKFGLGRSREAPTAVAAIGRVEPDGGVIAIASPPGDRLSRVLVKEGQFVTAGGILAYLESHAEREAESDALATVVEELKSRLTAEQAYQEKSIEEAKSSVSFQEQKGNLNVKIAQTTVLETKYQLLIAELELQQQTKLSSRDLVSKEDVEKARFRVGQAQQQLELVNAQLTLAQTSADQSLRTAQLHLAAAEAGRNKALSMIQLESTKKSFEQAKKRLERTIIRAPRDGQILKIMSWPGESTGTKPLLQMGDTKQMYVVAEVYETDISYVRSGQRATITSYALAGTLTGVVDRIGLLIHKRDVLHIDPAADADARVVEVWIKTNDSSVIAGLTNLQVDVSINVNATQ